MEKSKLRRADLLASIFLMVLSVFVFIGSLKIFFNPFGRANVSLTQQEIDALLDQWYTSPALLPLLLSVLIMICAIIYLRQASREGGKFDFIKLEKFKALIQGRETKVTLAIIGWLTVYVFVLIPVCRKTLDFFPKFYGFPFLIATFIYLGVFMITFNEKTKKGIILSLTIAFLGSAAIIYGFGTLAQIPLP